MLDYKGIVSAVCVAIYAILWPSLAYTLYRKSFGCSFPWFSLLLFSTLRVTENALQIAAEEDSNPKNAQHLVTGASICNAVGLGPLLIVATRLLLQCNDFIHLKQRPNQTSRALVTFELGTVISTVITIVGGVQSFKPKHIKDGVLSATVPMKVGISLYAATYVSIFGAALVVASRRNTYQKVAGNQMSISQRSFSTATLIIVACQTLIAVRLVYTLLLVFDKSRELSPLGDGNETIELCLANLPEWLVAGLYLCLSVMVRNGVPPEKERLEEGEERSAWTEILQYVPFVHWFIK